MNSIAFNSLYHLLDWKDNASSSAFVFVWKKGKYYRWNRLLWFDCPFSFPNIILPYILHWPNSNKHHYRISCFTVRLKVNLKLRKFRFKWYILLLPSEYGWQIKLQPSNKDPIRHSIRIFFSFTHITAYENRYLQFS